MNHNTRMALVAFVREIANTPCDCPLADAGFHEPDCANPDIQEDAHRLIDALWADETILD